MSKKLLKIDKQLQESSLNQMKSILKEKYACYVLITCSEPANDGKMEVEMSFEGDEDLAALLVDNASQVFDAKAPCRQSK